MITIRTKRRKVAKRVISFYLMEQQNAPEILFDPKQIGLEYVGVHELV